MNTHHHPGFKSKIMTFFDPKSLIVAAVVAAGGWAANTLIDAHGNAQTLATHSLQLDKLWQGQAQTHDDIQSLSVAVATVNGKLDVLGQKIDDDRAAKAATVHRFGAPALGAGMPAEAAAVTK